MVRILCYGDSNTWGSSDGDNRIEDAKQWPNILQQLLGDKYRVIQEGLGGRTAGNIETEKTRYNGQASFEVIYRSASPVDVVIISLGTNDLKARYKRTAQAIADDLLWYHQAIQEFKSFSEGKKTQILYITPANFAADLSYFEASQSLWAGLLEQMHTFSLPVLELPELPMSSDGLHYSKEAHQRVAELVAQKLEEINL